MSNVQKITEMFKLHWVGESDFQTFFNDVGIHAPEV